MRCSSARSNARLATPQALSELAHAWRLQGNLDEARGAASRAIGIAPELASAWFNLGAVQVVPGSWRETLDAIARELAVFVNDG